MDHPCSHPLSVEPPRKRGPKGPRKSTAVGAYRVLAASAEKIAHQLVARALAGDAGAAAVVLAHALDGPVPPAPLPAVAL